MSFLFDEIGTVTDWQRVPIAAAREALVRAEVFHGRAAKVHGCDFDELSHEPVERLAAGVSGLA